MDRKQRLSEIISSLETNGKITVNELVHKYKVSGTTIRTDLDELEEKGVLKNYSLGEK